ncbi:helix-turn-helix domain-containing protein [Patulibacter brassicae]|uniref:Helix-turn-helix domain-containing protein n=1 Tax=Patulibacter brassicae TaxID=1705717 RepID=A0ABU4VHU6_9ACTN|nr:helix-turn-helix domain-containing protein [Patulibacter brassicae]MDX8151343.1 helix-turn-helix domain-containing protein [Patulibacter brassicae]
MSDATIGPGQVQRAIDDAAAFLEHAAAELAPRTAAEIHEGVPELPDAAAVTSQSTSGVQELLAAHARAVRRGIPPHEVHVPEATLEHARMYVRRGIELPVLLRTYRVGQGVLWRLWMRTLDERTPDRDVRLAARDAAGELLFAYMDVIVGRIVEEYHAERDRWRRSLDARRADVVRDLLEGQPVDVDAAGRTLGRDLAGRHLGVVLWTDGDDAATAPARLERAAEEVAAEHGDGRPLVLRASQRVAWAWITPAAGGTAPRGGVLRRDGVSVALGEPGPGVTGFRETHEEAVAGRRLARAAGRPSGTVVAWQRSGLLGLLAAEPALARRFARRELGRLDVDDDATVRLRATLATFLREGSHVGRTAERLGVHPNTVGNRLRQCEAALGRPLDERRVELHAALLVRDGLRHGDPDR